jgi:hypothetical protein
MPPSLSTNARPAPAEWSRDWGESTAPNCQGFGRAGKFSTSRAAATDFQTASPAIRFLTALCLCF